MKIILIIGAMLSLMIPSTAFAATAANLTQRALTTANVSSDEKIKVTLKSSRGPACRNSDSATVTSGQDGMSFSTTFANLVAQGDASVNCQLVLSVSAPDNTTYMINKVAYLGDAHLSDGSYGAHTLTSYFSGSSTTIASQHNLTGPYMQDWDTIDSFNQDGQINWSPCGGTHLLVIKNYIQVIGPSTDHIRLDSSFFQLKSQAC